MKTTLYKQDVTGEIREWTIEKLDDESYIIEWGLLGGSLQEKVEYVEENQSGRNLGEQMMMRMASRIGKRRDQGYVNSIEEAEKPVTNAINMPRPMLAQKYKESLIPDKFLIQYKYDGNRCVITKKDGKVFGYSRNGKLFKSIDHILNAARDIPEGTFLDGELYHHGTPLQTLRSWIAKDQTESNNLVYMCYDIMMKASTVFRRGSLENLDLQSPILYAPTILCHEKEDIQHYFRLARSEGYEGLIVRDLFSNYEDGKRSKSLVKVKEWHSAEFLVTDVVASKDAWGVLKCIDDSGREFKVSAPGSIPEKTKTLINKELYIGRMVTVEFANLTVEGIPFHPVAISFRVGAE